MKPLIFYLLLFANCNPQHEIQAQGNENGLASDIPNEAQTLEYQETGDPKEGSQTLELVEPENWNMQNGIISDSFKIGTRDGSGWDYQPIKDSLYFKRNDAGTIYLINIPPENPNLFRDDCGNWYKKETFHTDWISNKIDPKREVEKHSFQIHVDMLDPCWAPNNYSEIEYRLDEDSKIEYSREVKVIYKKIEL